MANVDSPFGFRPVRTASGCLTVNKIAQYSIASGYNTAIGIGDPVKHLGTADTKGRLNIALAAAGEDAFGSFAGYALPQASGPTFGQGRNWIAGTTGSEIIAYVYDDPHIIYEMQADEDIVAGDIGQFTNWLAGTVDATTGFSTVQLDSSEIAQSGANGVKIIGIVEDSLNAYGNYTRCLVQINEHQMRDSVLLAV